MTDLSQPAPPVNLGAIRQSCMTCSLAELCLPVLLDTEDVEALDRIVRRGKSLMRSAILYRAGEPFRAIHAVRTGAFKASLLSADGVEQITSFYLPGELLGLDAIAFGRHPSTVEALETASVCEIPFHRLEHLSRQVPGLQRQMLRIMSREIFHEHQQLHSLASRNAEQRLAIVLLSLGERFGHRALSTHRFRLPMSRQELSNYLGLTPETLSRLFKRFVDQGWISATGREIELLEPDALQGISSAAPLPRETRMQTR